MSAADADAAASFTATTTVGRVKPFETGAGFFYVGGVVKNNLISIVGYSFCSFEIKIPLSPYMIFSKIPDFFCGVSNYNFAEFLLPGLNFPNRFPMLYIFFAGSLARTKKHCLQTGPINNEDDIFSYVSVFFLPCSSVKNVKCGWLVGDETEIDTN